MELEEKQNDIISYVTHAFLGIVMLMVAVVFYNEIKHSKNPVIYTEPFTIPEVKVLTSEEVALERMKLLPLATRASSTVEIPISGSATTNNVVVYNTEAEAKQAIEVNILAQKKQNPAPSYLINEEDYRKITEVKSQDGTIKRVFVSGNSNIQVSSAPEETEKLVAMSVSGFVTQKYPEGGWLAISKNDGTMTNVKITDSTKLLVNNKNIDFNSIKVADRITAEGFGPEGGNLTDTKVLLITGFYEIIPTN